MEPKYEEWLRKNMPHDLHQEYVQRMCVLWESGIEENKRCVEWIKKYTDILGRVRELRASCQIVFPGDLLHVTRDEIDELIPEARGSDGN